MQSTTGGDNNWESSWNDSSDWKKNDGAAVDKDEARKKREEKRNQRQKELEAKRSSRQGGGSLKLGAKKLASD